jgi:hypothetical protein
MAKKCKFELDFLLSIERERERGGRGKRSKPPSEESKKSRPRRSIGATNT